MAKFNVHSLEVSNGDGTTKTLVFKDMVTYKKNGVSFRYLGPVTTTDMHYVEATFNIPVVNLRKEATLSVFYDILGIDNSQTSFKYGLVSIDGYFCTELLPSSTATYIPISLVASTEYIPEGGKHSEIVTNPFSGVSATIMPTLSVFGTVRFIATEEVLDYLKVKPI